MANICWYQIRVRAKKENAYMFYYTTPEYNNKEIITEMGDKDDYTIIYKGDCKWSLNSYCQEKENIEKIDVSNFIKEDFSLSNDVSVYWYHTLKNKSKMFECEIEVFSEYEDYCVRDNSGDIPTFEHYKNGEIIEKINLPYNEMKNKLEILFEIPNIIHEYEEIDDGLDIFDWLYGDCENDEEDVIEQDENISTFPFKVELYHTELEGGTERAEKYQVGDKVYLKCIQEEYGYSVRVAHELGYVGNFYEFAQYVKTIQNETNNDEPLAKIVEVEPLSKRNKRCKKPIVVIEVYLKQ